MAICLLVYKMSGSPQSIKNGLIDFSVKLCVSRSFEMKMTTKGKWQDEVKSDVLGSLSQDTEGVGRTDGPTDIVYLITKGQAATVRPSLTANRHALFDFCWRFMVNTRRDFFFFYPHSNKNGYKKNLKVRGAIRRPNENLPRTSAQTKEPRRAENNNLTAAAISLNTASRSLVYSLDYKF